MKEPLNPACTSQFGALTFTGASGGNASFYGYCFNGGAQIIVWVTDYNTRQQIGPEQYFTAQPDNFWPLPGMFAGSIFSCPSTGGKVSLHAMDFWGQRRADQVGVTVPCP